MNLSKNQSEALIKFRRFVSFRNKISLILSCVVFACYYAFVLCVGLAPEILGYKIGPSSITLGIICGIFIIVLSVVLTGLYTFLANIYFDKEQTNSIKELQEAELIQKLQNGEITYKGEV